jgi:hypothetical protein
MAHLRHDMPVGEKDLSRWRICCFRCLWKLLIAVLVATSGAASIAATAGVIEVGRWDRFEWSVTNTTAYQDPYRDVTLDATFVRPDGNSIPFWGFYDGGSTWRLRCMPDQLGVWTFTARFSDGTAGGRGAFECVASDLPGLAGAYEANPVWFGFKGGGPLLIRSFHCGDRFFAANWDDPADPNDGERRRIFLDWAQGQGYNTLSIASHYQNRRSAGRGSGWETPELWPLDASEFQRMEMILDDLATRRILVFPFAGFFGRDADWPRAAADQTCYLRYTLARLGAYWNLLLNVGGPEPLLRNRSFLSFTEVCRLGREIRSLDVFGHALTVHNATGDDIYRGEPWPGFGTLQGPKTTDRQRLAEGLLRNHHPSRPLFAQETLWPGNAFGHPAYSDDDIRRNAFVILFSGAMINYGDMDGSSSSGFSNSMDPGDAIDSRHAIIRHVWDTFAELPWSRTKARSDLVNVGYCLADPGQVYLVYLEDRATVHVKIRRGVYHVEWINARQPGERHSGDDVTRGRGLRPPGEGDWVLRLDRVPIRETDGQVAFEAEFGEGVWSIVPSPTGQAIRDPGRGRMRYTIAFTQPGKYYVFLLAQQGPRGQDKENDVLLSLGGEKLYGSDGVTRPDGMRSYGDWKWTKLPKGPGSHTPDVIRRDAVYFLVERPGAYVFEIAHRSANFAIDKVVMKLDDPTLPTGPQR